MDDSFIINNSKEEFHNNINNIYENNEKYNNNIDNNLSNDENIINKDFH